MKKLSRIMGGVFLLLISLTFTSCEWLDEVDNPVQPAQTSSDSSEPTTPTNTPTTYSDKTSPLTFEATKDGVTVMLKFSDNAKPDYKKVEYSLDGGATWTALSSKAQAITLAKKGDKVMFRGDNPTYNGDAQFIIEQATSNARAMTRATPLSALSTLYGNLMSMIQSKEYEAVKKLLSENQNTFKGLLKNALIDAQSEDGTKKLVITVEQLVEGSLQGLFEGSTITVAPTLNLTQLVSDCLKDMCKDCQYLENMNLSFESVAAGLTVDDCLGGAIEGAGVLALNPTAVIDCGDQATAEAAAHAIVGSSASGGDSWNLVDGDGEDILTADKEVTGVKLSKTELTLEIDASETLTATVSPEDATNKDVTWKTSDEKIATVVNGKVTAVKVGTATITATAGEKSATCEVTVIDSNSATMDITYGEQDW